MENEENKGLLKKAQEYLAENTPAFSIWVKRNGFKRAFIISKSAGSNYYCVSDNFAFKARELYRFFETKDFWFATISKAFEWQCFSKDFNELEKFKKFFPETLFHSISKLIFLPFFDKEEPKIFVSIEYDDEDELTLPEASKASSKLGNIVEFNNYEKKTLEKFNDNIETGLEISNSRLYILSLKTCIENELKDISYPEEQIKENIGVFLTENAQFQISHLFRKPNCSHHGKNGEIKVALFAKDVIEEQLLAHHIAKTLTELFSEESAKEILLLPAGECPNKKGTIAFLTQG